MDRGLLEDDEVSGVSAELRRLFERAPGLAVVLRGPHHLFDYANPGYLRLMGLDRADGRPLREVVPELVDQGFIGLLDEVYRTGVPFEAHAAPILLPPSPGEPVAEGFFDFVYQPIVNAAGEIVGIFAQGADVTDRVNAERALRESEARFSDIFSQVTVGIGQTDITGRFLLVNDRLCEIAGRSREELLGLTMQEITHPDDLPGNRALFHALVETGRSFVIEKRYVRPDRSMVWVHNNVSLVRDAEGRPKYVTAVIVDVTEAKLAEARQRLLINELNHRVKNTLATVQFLAAQAARGDPRTSYAAFMDRLMALSAAHDVLTLEQWEGADLSSIVAGVLRPFETGDGSRLQRTGGSLRLTPRKALAVAMAVHELATNAVKYGALSRDGGRVLVAWRAVEEGFEITWTEIGGPPVSPPAEHGFGSRLLQRLAQELGGALDIDYAPSGLVCSIRGRTSEPQEDAILDLPSER